MSVPFDDMLPRRVRLEGTHADKVRKIQASIDEVIDAAVEHTEKTLRDQDTDREVFDHIMTETRAWAARARVEQMAEIESFMLEAGGVNDFDPRILGTGVPPSNAKLQN